MITLEVFGPEGGRLSHEVTGDAVIIGRSSRADLTLADRSLSRLHARLYQVGDEWFVEDLDSRNGTYLNQQRVSGPVRLRPGDAIGVGSCIVRVPHESSQRAAEHLSGHTVLRPAAELLSQHHDRAGVVPGNEKRLRVLNQVHEALGRTIELGELLDLILDRVFTHLAPEDAAVFLSRGGGYYCAASRSQRRDGRAPFLSQSLVREVVEKGHAALVLDTENDVRFNQAESLVAAGVRCLVAAPLLDPDGSLGMIVLSSRLAVRLFSEEDLELLVSLASIAAMRIQNLRLAEEAGERRRLQAEVDLARRIQSALLPTEMPVIEGYEIFGGNLPSRGVSGDFFKVMQRRQGSEWVLMIADVAGKGIAAALLTASLEALSMVPIESGMTPEEICAVISRLFHDRTPPEKYATAFVGVLDTASGVLSYASAGHNPGLLVRADGNLEWMGATGVPLGLLACTEYAAESVVVAPGDLVVLYTDGITEADSPEQQEYGSDRLAALCQGYRSDALDALAEAIQHDLESFVRGETLADDQTLLLLRRRSCGLSTVDS